VSLAGVRSPVLMASGGAVLAVRTFGSGPRMVALHGGPGLDHHVLIPMLEPLAGRFEMWLPDLPGHGRSEPLRGDAPGLGETLEIVGRWLPALPGTTEVLLGHSLGAWLVQELLRARRLQPRAAVLISPPAGGRESGRTAVRRRAASDLPPASGNWEKDVRQARAAFADHLGAECGGEVPADLLSVLDAVHVKPAWVHRRLLRELHRTLLGPNRPFDPRCPVLVLAGEADRTTPLEQAASVAAALRGADLLPLPSTGHYPLLRGQTLLALQAWLGTNLK
jgi:pimeloyl-ACP methyl ester carboxylesterase